MTSSIPTEYLFTKTSLHPQFQQNIYSPKRHDILYSNRISIHQNVMASSIPTENIYSPKRHGILNSNRISIHQNIMAPQFQLTKTSWQPQFQQNIYSPKNEPVPTECIFTKTSLHPQFQQNIYSPKRHCILNSN